MVVYQQLYEKTHIDSHQIDTSIGNIEPHFVTFKQKLKKKTCSLWRSKMEEGGKSLKVFFQWSCDEIQSVVKLALVSTRVPDHECVIHSSFVTRLSSKHIQKIMEVNDFPILNYRRGLFPPVYQKCIYISDSFYNRTHDKIVNTFSLMNALWWKKIKIK